MVVLLFLTKHMKTISTKRINELERNLAIVRMIRRSSTKVRGKLSFKSVDSTWKVSSPTGKFLQSLILNHNET